MSFVSLQQKKQNQKNQGTMNNTAVSKYVAAMKYVVAQIEKSIPLCISTCHFLYKTYLFPMAIRY